MKEFVDIARLGVLIYQTYNKASDNEEMIRALSEIKIESQRLYELETKKLLSLIPQSCSWLYDMYTLPEPLSNEAVKNLYKSSTELMGYYIYKQELPEHIWRFCVCLGSWLKYVVLCKNDVVAREGTLLLRNSLDTSLFYTKNLFSNLLTQKEISRINKIENRELHNRHSFYIQTQLLLEDEMEIKKEIIID